jgi:hypothetical protein
VHIAQQNALAGVKPMNAYLAQDRAAHQAHVAVVERNRKVWFGAIRNCLDDAVGNRQRLDLAIAVVADGPQDRALNSKIANFPFNAKVAPNAISP